MEMNTEDVKKEVMDEVKSYVQSEVDRAVKAVPTPGNDEVIKRLDSMSSALDNIAASEKDSSKNAKLSAIGSIALLAVFVIFFLVITPSILKFIKNLNGTVESLSATVQEVNGVVASADETVKGLNGVVSEVGTGINDTFSEVQGLIGTVNT